MFDNTAMGSQASPRAEAIHRAVVKRFGGDLVMEKGGAGHFGSEVISWRRTGDLIVLSGDPRSAYLREFSMGGHREGDRIALLLMYNERQNSLNIILANRATGHVFTRPMVRVDVSSK